MTWHSIFDLSTMEHRHLLAAYLTVFALQGGYAARLAIGWLRTRKR